MPAFWQWHFAYALSGGTKRDNKEVVVLSDAPDVNTGRLRAMPFNNPTLDWELTPGVKWQDGWTNVLHVSEMQSTCDYRPLFGPCTAD